MEEVAGVYTFVKTCHKTVYFKWVQSVLQKSYLNKIDSRPAMGLSEGEGGRAEGDVYI